MIPSCRTPEGVERSLKRMSGYVRRPNPPALGGVEPRKNMYGLHQDFREFPPLLEQEVNEFLDEQNHSI